MLCYEFKLHSFARSYFLVVGEISVTLTTESQPIPEFDNNYRLFVLSGEFWDLATELHASEFPHISIYRRSSCLIARKAVNSFNNWRAHTKWGQWIKYLYKKLIKNIDVLLFM